MKQFHHYPMALVPGTQQAHKGQHGTGAPFGCGTTLHCIPLVLAMWARNRARDSSQYIADERRHEITNLMKKSF